MILHLGQSFFTEGLTFMPSLRLLATETTNAVAASVASFSQA